jgi:hypothetical protein
MKKKRGLSSIIVTVLLIGLTIVGVGIVWAVVSNIIKTGTKEVGLNQFSLSAEISDVSLNNPSNNVSLALKRNAGKGDLNGVSFVFSNDAGTEIKTENVSLKELEQMKFNFHLNTNVSSLIKISVYPLIKQNGKESRGNILYTYYIHGTGTYVPGNCNPVSNPCGTFVCGSAANGTCGQVSCGSCPLGQFCNLTSNTCYNIAALNMTCSDGTLNYTCSTTKPKYCVNATLINKCLSCGCTNDKSCNLNQTCSSKQCSDSDGGLNYYTKGIITLNNGTFNDTCTGSNMLKEFQCFPNNSFSPVNYNCPDGCLNGACVNATCSDGTLNATCSIIRPKYCLNKNLIDNCNSCGCLVWQTCNTASKSCYNNTCIDSDGGLNYLVQGTAISNGQNWTDYCFGSSSLVEFQCVGINTSLAYSIVDCFTNFHLNCSNGACF